MSSQNIAILSTQRIVQEFYLAYRIEPITVIHGARQDDGTTVVGFMTVFFGKNVIFNFLESTLADRSYNSVIYVSFKSKSYLIIFGICRHLTMCFHNNLL